ncbi:MAG TPA: hypothetical protein VHM88_17555, partial [Candidatus Acidoferrales bacterium]|nr:hypothetical protein [Candidatus Acidoferrales bacterium]
MGSIGLEKPQGVVTEQASRLAPAALARSRTGPLLRSEAAIAVSLAGGVCLLHFLVNGRYGYFRDEL